MENVFKQLKMLLEGTCTTTPTSYGLAEKMARKHHHVHSYHMAKGLAKDIVLHMCIMIKLVTSIVNKNISISALDSQLQRCS